MARLGGNFGAVYVGTSPVKILDIYDWTWEASTELLNASIKMDIIERWIPSHGTGYRFTAKRRNQGTTVFPALVFDSAVNATQTTWRLDLVDNNNSFVQISGKGYARTTSLNAPADTAVDETFELQFDEAVVVSL
jgi:hypothetical protein